MYVRTYVRTCVRACVRACVHACVRALFGEANIGTALMQTANTVILKGVLTPPHLTHPILKLHKLLKNSIHLGLTRVWQLLNSGLAASKLSLASAKPEFGSCQTRVWQPFGSCQTEFGSCQTEFGSFQTIVRQLPNLVWQLPNSVWQLPNLVWQLPTGDP